MKSYTVALDSAVAALYETVAEQTGRSMEQVLADALFYLAGSLCVHTIEKQQKKKL